MNMNKKLEKLIADGLVKETSIIPIRIGGELQGHYVIGADAAAINGDSSSLTVIDPSEKSVKVQMSTAYGVQGNPDSGRNVFAIYKDTCITKNVTGDIEHRIYLKREFGVSADDYNQLVRGYIKPGQVIFYKTNGYIISDDIPAKVLTLLLLKHIELFGHGEVKIYNDNNGTPEMLDIMFACENSEDPKTPRAKLYFAKYPQK